MTFDRPVLIGREAGRVRRGQSGSSFPGRLSGSRRDRPGGELAARPTGEAEPTHGASGPLMALQDPPMSGRCEGKPVWRWAWAAQAGPFGQAWPNTFAPGPAPAPAPAPGWR